MNDVEDDFDDFDDEPCNLMTCLDSGQIVASQDRFFGKIFFNVLKTVDNNSVANAFFIRDLRQNPGSIKGSWIEYLNKLETDYIGDGKERKYVLPTDFLKAENISHIANSIRQEHPWVDEPFEIGNNATVLGEMLELDRTETLILELALRLYNPPYSIRDVIEELAWDTVYSDRAKLYARVFGLSEQTVRKSLKGFLFQSGFVTQSDSVRGFDAINEEMADLFDSVLLTPETLEQHLFPNNLDTELTVENFPHLTKQIGILERVINQALKEPSRGINGMLWGVAGGGKTELALALARKNGWDLKVIGDIGDADVEEKSRTQRLTSLKIAMKLYARKPNVVLLFDEMEDLFKDDKDQNFSKAFINRTIDYTQIPIIWTTNKLEQLGAAVLRRMVYNIEFDVPPASTRRSIWDSCGRKYGVELDPTEMDNFADTYDMVPALINNTIRIAKMTSLPKEEIPEVLRSLDTLMNFGEKRKFDTDNGNEYPYDLSVVNADTDLFRLTERLRNARPNFSLCLYGVPGVGKSAYGKHLAKVLGKKVVFKRASDLISKWVGETEQNIAAAFKQAEESERVLMIDEGDTFLRSRELAQRSYEVSEVNEMLSQMETIKQPFIITSNLMDMLDAASLRRFTFKVKFDFMKPEQAASLFRTYFGVDAPVEILKNVILAPGDFANVKRKVDILGITDADEIYGMISAECDLKPQKEKTIGFGR